MSRSGRTSKRRSRAQRKQAFAVAMATIRFASMARRLARDRDRKRRAGKCTCCGKKKCACGASRRGGRGAKSLGSVAVGSVALGASAFGAAAFGAVAIKRLAVKRASVGRTEVRELKVGRLEVGELIAPNLEQSDRPQAGARAAASE